MNSTGYMGMKATLILAGISGTVNKNENAGVADLSGHTGDVQLSSPDNHWFSKKRWFAKNILDFFKDKFFVLSLNAQEILYILYK
jgi:hypothetical protein